MAVILAIGGGAFIGGLLLSDTSDSYSYYSDYSDYDDYDDIEVRRLKRLEVLKSDVESAVGELEDYKEDTVNPELESDKLKAETAMKVSAAAMDKDVNRKIQNQIDAQMQKKAGGLQQELKEINNLLKKIDKIERENEI